MATAELRRRLVQLDAQIVEQRAILDALERTRLDVDRELRATATFPVVELPVEVTAKIFHSCFQNFSRNPNRRRYDYAWHGITRFAGIMRLVPHTPLVLASVCQRWRAIALSTPELWSQMEYSFPEAGMSSKFSSEVETREATEKITRWLDRAGSRPLSIHRRAGQNVVCNNVIPDSSHTPNRVRELINAHSVKVQHLELDMPESVIRQLGLDCRWFPLLKSVSLGVSSSDGSSWDDSDEPDETELHIFANAPLLHKLRNYRPLLSWVILP
ncbi:hypothetical protein B0H17DRAFT_1199515 [Mycena rosella]|uniref:F-box domain-containing protein n=1 Tax=Mycena rosella TaxID=1033263 RepID=A0AAD7DKY8_MYCRO|nr:hypothetical protein B0H17DRAFT_1199515 [Mycena rosella]